MVRYFATRHFKKKPLVITSLLTNEIHKSSKEFNFIAPYTTVLRLHFTLNFVTLIYKIFAARS